MPPYRAVLFDFFGTLTYSVRRNPLHAETARALGCSPRDLVAVLDRSFYPRSRGLCGSVEGSLRWACHQFGLDPTPGQLRAALSARITAIQADMTLRSDAKSVLWSLRQRGLRTALVSDCGYELPTVMPDLAIAPLLDTRVYSVDVGECKPHPAVYLTACDRLGVAPQDCVYIGDGGSQELTGAANLGMTAVRLATPDLASHFVFNAEHGWTGPTAASLTEAAAFAGSDRWSTAGSTISRWFTTAPAADGAAAASRPAADETADDLVTSMSSAGTPITGEWPSTDDWSTWSMADDWLVAGDCRFGASTDRALVPG